MTLPTLTLPEGRLWLRVADPGWTDPLDVTFSARVGGRWNPPGAFPVLYLSADLMTAQMQVERLLAGTPATVEDLDDEAFDLVVVVLPAGQRAANLGTPAGLAAAGLPASYPLDGHGTLIPHSTCQPVGARAHHAGLNGIWCRSAAGTDGRGRELAWFARRDKARIHRNLRLPFGAWRHASAWTDLRLRQQADVAE